MLKFRSKFLSFLPWIFSITVVHATSLKRNSESRPFKSNLKIDTVRVKAMIEQARHVMVSGLTPANTQIASALSVRALALSGAIDYPEGEVKSMEILYSLGSFKRFFDPVIEKQRQRALTLLKEARRLHSPLREADAKLQLTLTYLHDLRDTPQAEVYCLETLQLLRKYAYRSERYAKALCLLGQINCIKARPEKTVVEVTEAIAIAKANRVVKLQSYYAVMVSAYQNLQNFKEVLKWSLMALNIAEKYQDKAVSFDQYTVLAYYYSRSGNFEQELFYLEKAKPLVDFKNNSNRAIYIIAALADVYNRTHQYQKAISIVKQNLDKGSISQNEYFIDLYTSLMESLLDTRQYAAAALLHPRILKEYNHATINVTDFTHSYAHQMKADAILARFFMETHQYALAKPHLTALGEKAYVTPWESIYLIIYEQLAFKLDSATANLSGALRHFKKYKSNSDSLNNVWHARDIDQLQVQYETGKKDAEIALKAKNISLLQRQSKMQQQAIKSDKLVKSLSLAGVVMLSLLSGISYNRYRIKQRANQELEEQQEEINTQNESLLQLLAERDWLLKEIHHRVKNNLQIVISLLNSQLADIKDVAAKNVIRESQHRMHSISLIHQRLYQHDNLSGINIKDYIFELTGYLLDSFNADNSIGFLIDADTVLIDVSQAVSLGLIINEAVTNAIKHAFKGRDDKGIIKIQAKQSEANDFILSIADNGIGLSPAFEPQSAVSLGMKLISGLTRQLRGQVSFITDQGLKIIISMPLAGVSPLKPGRV